jgi:hypothetical protein
MKNKKLYQLGLIYPLGLPARASVFSVTEKLT